MKFGILIGSLDVKVLLKLTNDRIYAITAQSRAVGKLMEQYPGEKAALENWRERILLTAKDMRNEKSPVYDVKPEGEKSPQE
tara:strand:- start:1880 stop:2125 length:246 start_codon:yes stop_codon:yes gene_type:complete